MEYGRSGAILVGAVAGLVVIALLPFPSASSAASGAPAAGTYNVTFLEGTACGNGHFTEWGVQLGSLITTEPSNVAVSQISENGYSMDDKFNLTTITFSVPDGVYPFTLYPNFLHVGSPDGWEMGDSGGLVTVTNSNVTVYTIALAAMCGP
jgi:hypothetical protein